MVYKLLYYQGAASQVTAVTVTNVKHSAQLVNLVNIGGVSQLQSNFWIDEISLFTIRTSPDECHLHSQF